MFDERVLHERRLSESTKKQAKSHQNDLCVLEGRYQWTVSEHAKALDAHNTRAKEMKDEME